MSLTSTPGVCPAQQKQLSSSLRRLLFPAVHVGCILQAAHCRSPQLLVVAAELCLPKPGAQSPVQSLQALRLDVSSSMKADLQESLQEKSAAGHDCTGLVQKTNTRESIKDMTSTTQYVGTALAQQQLASCLKLYKSVLLGFTVSWLYETWVST